MKKIFVLIFMVVSLFSPLFEFASPATAAGCPAGFLRLAASPQTLLADNTSKATVSVFSYWKPNPETEQGESSKWMTITVTGSGNTVSSNTLTTDEAGKGTFTVSSSVPEQKTISVSRWCYAHPDDPNSKRVLIDEESVTLTFTQVAPPPQYT